MEDQFEVILLGIIYDPSKKKILLGKRENDPYIKKLTWCFPGGSLHLKEDISKTLKKKIKEKTGYEVKNLGTIFAKVYPEKGNLLAVYFLTEIFKGKEKVGDDFVELKWVKPEEVEKHFTTSFHPALKEYIMNLR